MKQLFIVIIFIPYLLFSQTNRKDNLSENRHRFLSININIIQLPINEINFYLDFFISKKHSFGINFSSIYANKAFEVFFLSQDQGDYPGTVWNGLGTRINYKYYYSRTESNFFSLQVLYKNIYYRNQKFINLWGDNDNTFVRSEDAFLLGIDLLHGTHLKKITSNFNFEIFYGLGIRYRERNYTTISSNAAYFPYPKPVGTFTLRQTYPTIIFGLKIGVTTFITKDKKTSASMAACGGRFCIGHRLG